VISVWRECFDEFLHHVPQKEFQQLGWLTTGESST
jgi:hypothetical protein